MLRGVLSPFEKKDREGNVDPPVNTTKVVYLIPYTLRFTKVLHSTFSGTSKTVKENPLSESSGVDGKIFPLIELRRYVLTSTPL